MALTETKSLEEDIRKLITTRVQGVREKNVDATASLLAPDVLMYDVITPLLYSGADQVRDRTSQWFSSFETPIRYDIRDLSIVAAGELAFCHFLYRVSGTIQGGQRLGMWVRATLCFQKADEQWLIVHEHNSVPFDPKTGMAVLDSSPD